jgi:sulfate adenylyltransferase
MSLIQPHGGHLIDRIIPQASRDAAEKEARSLASITLSAREACDLEMIAIGAFSPLTGFQGQADFERVARESRLANGTVWPIPVTLSPEDAAAEKVFVGDQVALKHPQGAILGILQVTEKYRHDKDLEIPNVYGTTDPAHPGVAETLKQGNWNLAGPVRVITPNPEPEFPEYRLTPAQTRAAFAQRGWNTVSAFQTRNPIHRAHEYLTKVALEMTDGLLIHPLVGATKSDDIPADVRMECYKVLIDNYYNPRHTMLSVMPLAMRYAGPREAILHALIRKNYGVTHFIVGRDHAGVGNYYGTYDAQKIFDNFDPAEIGITPLKFEHTFFCTKSGAMASSKTTNSSKEQQIMLSGTKVRELLRAGQRPPVEFTRAEVADVLIRWAKTLAS